MALDPRMTTRLSSWLQNSVAKAPTAGIPAASTQTPGGGILSDANPAATTRNTATTAQAPVTGILAPSTAPQTAATPATTAPAPPAVPVTDPATPATTPPATAPATPPAPPRGTPTPPPPTPERTSGAPTARKPREAVSPVTTLDPEDLTQREANPDATVESRITGLLGDNSDYIQGFRDRAMRAANKRGLLNSTMAAGAGEEAAAAGALPIATADAGYFASIDEYNTALKNQAVMFNAEAKNTYSLADLQSATQLQIALSSQSAQITAAEIASATSRFNAEISANASKYGNDTQARIAADNNAARARDQEIADANAMSRQNSNNHDALVNNILLNADLPPERRADLLRSLGEPELAAGIFVVNDTGHDLAPPSTDNGQGSGG